MAYAFSARRLFFSLVSAFLILCSVPSAFALSAGCSAVNALSGSSALSFASNRYPASDFAAGDALTLSFTDSGGAYGGSPAMADSVSLARYNLSSFQTYNAANATSSTPQTVTITVPSGSLEANGIAIRATTSNGQISNLVFNCTSASTASGDATLSGLSLSSGTLSPSFSAATSSYSASVVSSVSSVTVTPVVTESHATVTVNGTAVAPGSASQSVSLTSGSTTSISIVVTAQDGTTRGYTLSVTRAEAAPVSSGSAATVAADSTNNVIPLSLSGGVATSVAIVSPPAHGSATVSGTSVIYTPTAGYSGSDSFTWHASNGGGTSADATVSLTVTPPVLTVTPASGALTATTVGSTWSQRLTVSGGTSPWTWSSTALPAGIALDATTGTLSGTPSTAGSYGFQVTATDANGATGSASYTFVVNTASPIASDSTATVTANSSSNPVTLNLSGGRASSLSIVNPPGHGSLAVSGLTVAYTPAAGYAGSDSFTYTATNSSGTSASARVSLTVTPVLLTLSPGSGALNAATAGSRWSQTLTASGGSAPYTFSATPLPDGVTLNAATGALAGTPSAAGSYRFQVTAADSQGNSGTASYSLVVSAAAPAALQLQPAGGALPEGKAGQAYSQFLSVTGGTAPYRWQLSGALPRGLAFGDGQLSGTPQVSGSSTFSVLVTDATGRTLQAGYSLDIAASAPSAADHAATVAAGESVTISLTSGATGGPFTGARLQAQPDSSLGKASIQASGADYQLLFTAAAQASGTLTLRYALTSAAGTTSPALITLTITARPDPSKDADVIGLVSAQYQAAQNFARAQLRNFSDRLEQLHRGSDLPSDMAGVHFSLPSSSPERDADRDMWTTAWQQKKSGLNDLQGRSDAPELPFATGQQARKLSYWTGGYVDFGGDSADGVRFSHTTVGVTTGADYRFSTTFTGGAGIGFGRDVSDVGDNDTRTNGRALSAALYGSYHPGPFFVDGLLGQGTLNFDSRRAVTNSDAVARGSRSGRQVFTSLTSGYEYRAPEMMVSPYGRLQYTRTRLDGFSESGAGAYNLAYAPQAAVQVLTAAGLRGERSAPVSWGLLRLQGRVEYAQTLSGSESAGVGYADTANDSWRVSLFEQSRRTLTFGAGIDFLLPYSITPGIAYQGTVGLDGANTREQLVMIRINIGL